MDPRPASPKLFISYNRADLAWAEWIAWVLEEAGYSTVVQAWDFRPGSNFVLEMQRAATTTDKTLIVLSESYLHAEFTQPEWAAAFAQDPQGRRRKLIPLRIQDCFVPGLLAQIVSIDLFRLSREDARKALLQGLAERGKPAHAPDFPNVVPYERTHLDLGRLPATGPHLVGREAELARLDAAWADPSIHVLSLVAIGGMGKSALVAHWLDQMAASGWRGAERALDWSFYSQGGEGRVATAEPFLDYALRAFGDPAPDVGSPHDRGVRLARLGRERCTLLVLDGVEPLQHAPGGPLAGRLKDPGLAALLKGLAAGNSGLCVVTTREPISDLASNPKTAPSLPLEALRPEAGIDLLRQLGVTGKTSELRSAVREMKGHALTLILLGNYLRRAHGGDLRKRSEIDLREADERQGGHAFRVLSAYTRWLQEGPELSILRLLGLFESPAGATALTALRAEPVIPGLTEPLTGLTEEGWRWAVSNLREHGLLSTTDPHQLYPLDLHPLVRTYFKEELKQRPEAWTEGNLRLYEVLKKSAPDYPETLEGMQPLYAAVVHGCRAGMHQKAMSEVFWPRIRRGKESFSLHTLGAFGSELTAMAAFFDHLWDRPSFRLLPSDQTWLLNDAGYCLRALGRLTEALQPMQAGLEAEILHQEWEEAAIRLNNLSSLCLTLGNLEAALVFGKQGIEIADLGSDSLYKRANRALLADVLHQAGHWKASRTLFEETETLQAKEDPVQPRLIALKGYRYCDFLLSAAEPEDGSGLDGVLTDPRTAERFRRACEEVQDRAAASLLTSEEDRWLLDIGLDHLLLGRAYFGLVLTSSEEARDSEISRVAMHLDKAVQFIRQAAREDHSPRALLARAAFQRFLSDHAASAEDLTTVLEIAERSGMRLYECDAHLEWARLHLNQNDFAAARKHISRAGELIALTGYVRRKREVAYWERYVPKDPEGTIQG